MVAVIFVRVLNELIGAVQERKTQMASVICVRILNNKERLFNEGRL